jgi:hypothetical protein
LRRGCRSTGMAGLRSETKRNAGELVARLYELRAATLATGELSAEFEVIARAQGIQALRQHCEILSVTK